LVLNRAPLEAGSPALSSIDQLTSHNKREVTRRNRIGNLQMGPLDNNIRSLQLRNNDFVIPFLAGLGTGVAAAFLLTNGSGHDNRSRIREIADSLGDALKKGAGELGDATGNAFRDGKRVLADQRKKKRETMSDLRNQVTEKLDDTAAAAKTMAGGIAEISKELAHSTGKALEAGGKHLQDA
jgi:hypothetical protein